MCDLWYHTRKRGDICGNLGNCTCKRGDSLEIVTIVQVRDGICVEILGIVQERISVKIFDLQMGERGFLWKS